MDNGQLVIKVEEYIVMVTSEEEKLIVMPWVLFIEFYEF